MAVAFIMDFEATLEQYDAILADMHLEGRLPPGALFHAAGRGPRGIRVVDVWETPERFEQFSEEAIRPMTAKHGVGEPRLRMVPVEQSRPGPARGATFLQVVVIPGLDRDAFRSLDAQVLPGGEPPAELEFHVNGPLDDDWCVIDTWTSKEARDAFLASRVQPAVQAAGIQAMPQIDDMEIHNTLVPAQAGART